MTSKQNLADAITAAAGVYVREALGTFPETGLNELALSGPANEFAEAWAKRPAYERLAMLLTYDDAIRSLLKPSGKDAPTLYSFFAGTTLWALQLPAALLASALFDHMMLGIPRTVESVLSKLLDNIEALRSVALGREIECSWVAGLIGFDIAPAQRLATALGELRPLEPPWDRLPVWGEHRASVLMSGSLRMRVEVVTADGRDKVSGDFGGRQEALDKVRLLRLAVMLCQTNAKSGNSQMTVLTAGAPHLGLMGAMTESHGVVQADVPGEPLPLAEHDEVRRWCDNFARFYNSSVGVAVERILSAATERQQPADILIDAVMAWENLVGTEVETSFRVTAALVCLLESDASKRQKMLRDLQTTYRIRSKVVHGEAVDYRDVSRHGHLALEIAKQAIRAIFESNTWLLELRSSTSRADAILLGDPRLKV